MILDSRRQFLKRLPAAALCVAAPSLSLYPLYGAAVTAGFQIHDVDWFDEDRERAVPIRLYQPSEASVTAPVPLVIFSHGIGGSRLGYSYLGRYWASHGLASLHVQHVGSDRSIWFGNPFNLVSRLQEAAQAREALNRVYDLRFALTRLLNDPLGQTIQSNQIIAAGHSYGANTTLLASGARVSQDNIPVDLSDARITAAIVISAPRFFGQKAVNSILQPVSLPTLHITSTEDNIQIPGYFSGYPDRLAIFEAIGSKRKALAVFEGGSHSMFTDRSLTGGAVLNQLVKEATQELSLDFIAQVLNNQESGIPTWAIRHEAILSKVIA
ncbi:acetylhydrolase [Polynucleobacter paneuropaeus]|jgi:predicted dienelactone hydrolase|nr:acetylhydrolase [Polynucleobacter paneuropaeus]